MAVMFTKHSSVLALFYSMRIFSAFRTLWITDKLCTKLSEDWLSTNEMYKGDTIHTWFSFIDSFSQKKNYKVQTYSTCNTSEYKFKDDWIRLMNGNVISSDFLLPEIFGIQILSHINWFHCTEIWIWSCMTVNLSIGNSTRNIMCRKLAKIFRSVKAVSQLLYFSYSRSNHRKWSNA